MGYIMTIKEYAEFLLDVVKKFGDGELYAYNQMGVLSPVHKDLFVEDREKPPKFGVKTKGGNG